MVNDKCTRWPLAFFSNLKNPRERASTRRVRRCRCRRKGRVRTQADDDCDVPGKIPFELRNQMESFGLLVIPNRLCPSWNRRSILELVALSRRLHLDLFGSSFPISIQMFRGVKVSGESSRSLSLPVADYRQSGRIVQLISSIYICMKTFMETFTLNLWWFAVWEVGDPCAFTFDAVFKNRCNK